MTAKRKLELVILAVLLLGAGWIAATRVPESDSASRASIPLPGHPAPDITVQTLDGKTLALSDLQGKAVVLNFWATWCPPCQAEMPELQAAHDAYADGGLVVLGVNQGEDAATVQAFLAQRGLDFPVALDPQSEASMRYLVNSLPTTFFIDRHGVIQDSIVGQMNAATLKQRLRSIYP